MWINIVNLDVVTVGLFVNDLIIALIIKSLAHDMFISNLNISQKDFINGFYRATLSLLIATTLVFNGILAYNASTNVLDDYTYQFPLFIILALLYGTIESSYDHFYTK